MNRRDFLVLTLSGIFGYSGASALDNFQFSLKPNTIKNLLRPRVIKFALSKKHALVLNEYGQIFGWGSNANCQLDIPFNRSFTDIATSDSESFGLTTEGELLFWGGLDFWKAYDTRKSTETVAFFRSSRVLPGLPEQKITCFAVSQRGAVIVASGTSILVYTDQKKRHDTIRFNTNDEDIKQVYISEINFYQKSPLAAAITTSGRLLLGMSMEYKITDQEITKRAESIRFNAIDIRDGAVLYENGSYVRIGEFYSDNRDRNEWRFYNKEKDRIENLNNKQAFPNAISVTERTLNDNASYTAVINKNRLVDIFIHSSEPRNIFNQDIPNTDIVQVAFTETHFITLNSYGKITSTQLTLLNEEKHKTDDNIKFSQCISIPHHSYGFFVYALDIDGKLYHWAYREGNRYVPSKTFPKNVPPFVAIQHAGDRLWCIDKSGIVHVFENNMYSTDSIKYYKFIIPNKKIVKLASQSRNAGFMAPSMYLITDDQKIYSVELTNVWDEQSNELISVEARTKIVHEGRGNVRSLSFCSSGLISIWDDGQLGYFDYLRYLDKIPEDPQYAWTYSQLIGISDAEFQQFPDKGVVVYQSGEIRIFPNETQLGVQKSDVIKALYGPGPQYCFLSIFGSLRFYGTTMPAILEPINNAIDIYGDTDNMVVLLSDGKVVEYVRDLNTIPPEFGGQI
jgi:hypothetical protein